MTTATVGISGADDSRTASDAAEARLCELLVECGRIDQRDLERVRRLHGETADTALTSLMLRLGLVSERTLADSWAQLLQLPLLDIDQVSDMPPADLDASPRFLRHAHVVPVENDRGGVVLAMADPGDAYARQAMELVRGDRLDLCVGSRSQIDDLIERYYGKGRSAMGTIVENLDENTDDAEPDVEQLRDLASEAPVIRLVNLIVQRAVETRASDIHIEPYESHLRVRFRIDGVLQDVEAPPANSTAAVISRVKIMAGLDIAEHRLPQDGRIQMRLQGKKLDLRVSTVPTNFGESVVMRILDRESVVLDFAELGFSESLRDRFVEVLRQPNGILLVTGPTGSGKTTTLYTALARINTDQVKIITVEDPVEYQLEGINQIQVKPSIGLGFADALRSIVRQDPDVIMIGETRDLETARIAIQSALTGHLVLSTLHTNSAAGSVTRLLDLGIEDYLLGSTINGIMAQRLVRKLDPQTAVAYEAPREVIDEFDLERYTAERPIRLRKPGSSDANPGGYNGRVAITELLVMDDALRRAVMQHADTAEIEKAARAAGMHTMFEDGLHKVVSGMTTLEELLRVTRES